MNGKLTVTTEVWVQLLGELDNHIAGRNISIERPTDLFNQIIDLAGRLAAENHVPIHIDPNLTTMWHVSLLLGAWVETLGNAKLYDPGRTDLTDEQRREIRNWLAGLPESAESAVRVGKSLGKEFQRRRTPNLVESWEW